MNKNYTFAKFNNKVKHNFNIFGLLVLVLTFSSCGTMKVFTTSDFSAINDVKDIEGYYLNRCSGGISILSRFNIRDNADFVTITFNSPSEIKLTYFDGSLIEQERIFTGKMKRNYFEIYFSKRNIFIPFIYGNFDIDRIRIGKTEDGKLLIREFIDNSGYLLFFAGGYSVETPHVFSYAIEHKDFLPIHENGLWGYSDYQGNIVIPKKYDFTSIFVKDVARVKLNNKWGVINRQGEVIIPFVYDEISQIDLSGSPPIFRVSVGKKVGVVDINGNETIPVIYDYIADCPSCDFFRIHLKDKKELANRTGVVIPAIYSEIHGFSGRGMAERDGKYYIIDKEGYEYETKGGLWNLTIIPETKRKIQFEEQEIE